MLRRSKSKRRASGDEPGPAASGVVVVGADADARELFARVVGTAGHDVEQVATADAAIKALSDHPRVALVALLASDGATALVARIRATEDSRVAHVPLVAITEDEPVTKAATAAGSDGTLTRPFHADELTEELAAVLARSPDERAEIRAGAAQEPDD